MWHVFARDRVGGEGNYLEAIGPTEAACLRDLAARLRGIFADACRTRDADGRIRGARPVANRP